MTEKIIAEDLMTSEEVAEQLRLSKRTVQMHAKSGEIPSIKVGGTYRFVPDDLKQYLAGKKTGKGRKAKRTVTSTARIIKSNAKRTISLMELAKLTGIPAEKLAMRAVQTENFDKIRLDEDLVPELLEVNRE